MRADSTAPRANVVMRYVGATDEAHELRELLSPSGVTVELVEPTPLCRRRPLGIELRVPVPTGFPPSAAVGYAMQLIGEAWSVVGAEPSAACELQYLPSDPHAAQ